MILAKHSNKVLIALFELIFSKSSSHSALLSIRLIQTIWTFGLKNPWKVENFLFNGLILGWFALQNIFISEKFYCWNPDDNPETNPNFIPKEEVLASLAANKEEDIHGLL